jgi:hypothetical protein
MEALQKTLFVLALLALAPQTVRHLYVKWLEPTTSVLDKYQPPLEEGIKKAGSLEELVKQYDEARKKLDEAKKKLPEDEGESSPNSAAVLSPLSHSESTLKAAIQDWESKAKEIFELRFFWSCGLVFLLLGLLCYRQQRLWLGLTLIASGISEMTWWTSPSFRWAGGSREFDKLLTNKIVFSLASIILLLITGHLVKQMNSPRVKL